MSDTQSVWQWWNDKTWVDFAPEHSEQLNTALSQGKYSTVVEHNWVNKKGKECTTKYTISFKDYTQTNGDSWTQRKIRCHKVKAMGPDQVKGAGDGWGYDEANNGADDDGWGWHDANDGAEADSSDKDKEKTSKDANDRDAAKDRDEDKGKSSKDMASSSKDMASIETWTKQDKKDSNEVDSQKKGVAANISFELVE